MIKGNEILSVNCGDSRAIIIENQIMKPLSNDHNFEIQEERKRIEESGGEIRRLVK